MQNQGINCVGSIPKEEYAGFFIRMGAFFLDMLMVSLALSPVRMGAWFLSRILNMSFIYNRILFAYTWVDIFCYIGTVLYFVIMTYLAGATLGKIILGIQVISVRDNGKNITDILYRETVGRLLSSILLIGYLLAAGDEEKAALHDRLSKTRVVYKKYLERLAETLPASPVEEPIVLPVLEEEYERIDTEKEEAED